MKKLNIIKKERKTINYATANVVPQKFFPYLYDLNPIYATVDSSVILGRDKEINRICNCFFKSKRANAVLVGEHGVGKTAIVQKLVDNVIHKRCPKEMYDFHFLALNVEAIVADIVRKSDKVNNILAKIVEFVSNATNLVIVIDQIQLIQADYYLSYKFATLVRNPRVKILGISTEEEFYSYFELDKKTRSRLEVIPILEPKPNRIYPMIKKIVAGLENVHRVTIDKNIIKYIINVSSAISSELCNPELTLDIIEKSMIVARRKHRKEVTRKDVNSNFNFNYELYSKMSKEDKKITAYHEAGHFIVSKMSENIKNIKTTAITIVPAEDFLGATMFEFEPEKQESCDVQYYIDNIAVDLAGREAEIIFTNSEKHLTSGAYQDLISATQTARDIVTSYGMIDNVGHNMSYLGIEDFTNISLLSENIKNEINSAVEKLILDAENRAKEILNEHKPLLERLAKELMSNEILDESDLERICREVEGK